MRLAPLSSFLTLITTLATAISAHADTTLWYGGDYWIVNGFTGGGVANEVSTTTGTWRAYDGFNVTASGWLVTGLFSVNAMRVAGITQASWELHSGANPSGPIIASGVSAATQTPNGKYEGLDASNWPECAISVNGLNLLLGPGTYWFSVAPLVGADPATDGYLDSYCTRTLGANAIGQLVPNDGSFYSMGVVGSVVPEPSAACLLALGAALLPLARKSDRKNPAG